jgi:glyoxylase-like metal-dependent hydrolase (beta-lactamase superfamily II)
VEITPGVRRIGPGLANVYLIEEAGAVTIVDAGMPGYWSALPAELAAMGRSLEDVRAVVLTHAHSDHIGFAERIRTERGVPIRVHELDELRAKGRVPGPKGLGEFKLMPLLGFLLFGLRNGLNSPPILEVSTFGDGATLDVPGAPRVIHVPGHTAGSAALYFAQRGVICVGDSFVTLNVINGRTGPQLFPNFNTDNEQAFASLARFDRVDARLVLPGHGAPWDRGLADAVRLTRENWTARR